MHFSSEGAVLQNHISPILSTNHPNRAMAMVHRQNGANQIQIKAATVRRLTKQSDFYNSIRQTNDMKLEKERSRDHLKCALKDLEAFMAIVWNASDTDEFLEAKKVLREAKSVMKNEKR